MKWIDEILCENLPFSYAVLCEATVAFQPDDRPLGYVLVKPGEQH